MYHIESVISHFEVKGYGRPNCLGQEHHEEVDGFECRPVVLLRLADGTQYCEALHNVGEVVDFLDQAFDGLIFTIYVHTTTGENMALHDFSEKSEAERVYQELLERFIGEDHE